MTDKPIFEAGCVTIEKNQERAGVTAQLPLIHTVGIKNLLDIKDLSFNDDGEVVDIKIVFKNGGTLDFNYEKSGVLNQLRAQNGVETSIDTESGAIMYIMGKS